MTSYQPEIMRCPNAYCLCEFTYMALASRNTFGATFFTDGHICGPMYSEVSAVIECPNCGCKLWLEDVPSRISGDTLEYTTHAWIDGVYTIKSRSAALPLTKAEVDSLPIVVGLYSGGYEFMLKDGFWSDEDRKRFWSKGDREKYVRIKAWRSFNDEYRKHPKKKFTISLDQEANLSRLLQLLDANKPVELILRAEALRELGLFAECIKELNQSISSEYLAAARTIKNRAVRKSRKVAEIRFPMES